MTHVSCMEATARRVGGLTAGIERSGGRLSCSWGLVCSTTLGEECLWASDQMVLTVDGGKVYVTKEND